MRILLSILILVLLTACSAEKSNEIRSDIFISSFDTGFDVHGKSILKDGSQSIHFSKDFWDYFIRTHPKSSGMIFIMPLYNTSNNYVSLSDTSYTFYNVTHSGSFLFKKLLADSVTGREKENQSLGSFFVMPNDTTGTTAKGKRIEQRLKDYKITPTVKKEFDRLKSILTLQDTSEHYVIVFRKSFADKIYMLYE
ncbi:hypothetical protein [Puia dinghuensis]|uniref:Lipoprotein n=1 Tax=Puia dinghuensis TaxID=1792502 RepID=A0A8J2UHH5_9BACT|nr:hypothetical protein [Puia dinghuensis]GGB18793.1 hypothetical protein GCM10011511_48250 [Puia dinghuensis]